jgi:hypothetical protein
VNNEPIGPGAESIVYHTKTAISLFATYTTSEQLFHWLLTQDFLSVFQTSAKCSGSATQNKQEPISPRKQTTTTHTMHLSAVHSSRYYSTRSEGMAAGATTCNTLVRRSEGTSEWDMVWIIVFSIVGAARVVGLILRSITSPSVRRAKRNRIYELRHRRVCYGEQ